jgi:hypothetical protein
MTSTDTTALEQHIQAATRALLEQQKPDGHWVFELRPIAPFRPNTSHAPLRWAG